MAQQHELSGLIGIPFDAGEWWSPWLHPMPIEWPIDSLYKVKKVPNLLLKALHNAVYVNNWVVSAHRGETRAEMYFCRPGRKYFCRSVSPRRGETCQHWLWWRLLEWPLNGFFGVFSWFSDQFIPAVWYLTNQCFCFDYHYSHTADLHACRKHLDILRATVATHTCMHNSADD